MFTKQPIDNSIFVVFFSHVLFFCSSIDKDNVVYSKIFLYVLVLIIQFHFFGFHSFIATDIVYDLYTIKSLISKKSLFVCSGVLFVFDFELFSLFFNFLIFSAFSNKTIGGIGGEKMNKKNAKMHSLELSLNISGLFWFRRIIRIYI